MADIKAIKKIKLNGNNYQVHPGYETTDDFNKANFAVGAGTEANGLASMAEGNGTLANGDYSHSQGFATIANGENQTVLGRPNIPDTDNYALIIGNGEVVDEEVKTRSNAMTVAWDGTVSAKRFVSEEQELELNLSGRNGINITSADDTVYVELDEDYNAFNVSARNGIIITSADDTIYFEIDDDYNAMELEAGQGIDITTAGNTVTISSKLDLEDMLTIQGDNIDISQAGNNVILSAEPGLSNYDFDTSDNITASIDVEDKIIHITATDYTADTLKLEGDNIDISQVGNNVILSAEPGLRQYSFDTTGIDIDVDYEDYRISFEVPDPMANSLPIEGENIDISEQNGKLVLSAEPGLSNYRFDTSDNITANIDAEDNIIYITATDYTANALNLEGKNINIYEDTNNKVIISANDAISEILDAEQNNIEIIKNNGQLVFTVPEQKNYTFTASGAAKVTEKDGKVTIYSPTIPDQMVYEVDSDNKSLLDITTDTLDNVTTFTFKPVDPMANALPLSGIGIDIQEKDNKLVLSAQQYNFVGENGIDIDVSNNNVTIFGPEFESSNTVAVSANGTTVSFSAKVPKFVNSNSITVSAGANDTYSFIGSTSLADYRINKENIEFSIDDEDNLISISAKDPLTDAATLSGVNININESSDNKTLIISAHAPSIFDNLTVGDTLTTDGNILNIDLVTLDERYSANDSLTIGNTLTTANNKLDVADNIFQKIEDVVIYDISAASKNLHINVDIDDNNGKTTYVLSADPTNYTFVQSGGMQIRQQGTFVTAYAPEKTNYEFDSTTPTLLKITNNDDLISFSAKDPLTDAMTLSAGAGIDITNNANTVKFSVVPGTYVTTAGNMVDVNLDALKIELDDEYAKVSKPVEGINLDIIEYDNRIVLSAGGNALDDTEYNQLITDIDEAANTVSWDIGTTDAFRPIGFADNGSRAAFTAGKQFTNDIVYDGDFANGFNYNPISHMMTVNSISAKNIALATDGGTYGNIILNANRNSMNGYIGRNNHKNPVVAWHYKNGTNGAQESSAFIGFTYYNSPTADTVGLGVSDNNTTEGWFYFGGCDGDNASEYLDNDCYLGSHGMGILARTIKANKIYMGNTAIPKIVPTATLPSNPDEDTYYLI